MSVLLEDYSEFAQVTTGANGTVVSGLPLESDVPAFQYRKVFDTFYPFAALGGALSKVVAPSWKIQILASAAEGAQVLFEQEVTLRFEVIVLAVLGEIGFFYWSPLDGANGIVKTTICNGQPVPVGEDGKPEGWKFVDVPRPTVNSELGQVRQGDFDDESDNSSASSEFTLEEGHIWGAFQSAPYLCDIPEGAVLKVVSDDWKVLRSRTLSFFFSFKEGGGQEGGHFDERSGQRFWLQSKAVNGVSKTVVNRSRRGVSPLEAAGVEVAGVVDGSAPVKGGKLTKLAGGTLMCVGISGAKIGVYESSSAGKTWTKKMEQVSPITTLLASCLTQDNTRYLLYGKNAAGKATYAILKREAQGWRLSESGTPTGPNLPLKGVSVMEAGEGGTVRLVVRDTAAYRVLNTNDGGKTYTEELLKGENKPAPAGGTGGTGGTTGGGTTGGGTTGGGTTP